uniref:Uncharacterized protein n=1 Tax=Cryptosporidium parvum TaxID=5807 RepID=F0X581_CRYPV
MYSYSSQELSWSILQQHFGIHLCENQRQYSHLKQVSHNFQLRSC